MIKEKTLTIPLTATAYRRFTDLGYDWTNKKEIEVKVEDLPKGSCREITAICDNTNSFCIYNIVASVTLHVR